LAAARQPAPKAWRRRDIERLGLPRYDAADLAGIKRELGDGAGFVVVDGVAPSLEDAGAGVAFTGFGEALGRLLPQNAKQETLVEIADFTDEDAFDDRGYRSPGELHPHTDPPPLIALLCRRAARTGGANRLISAEAIRHSIRDSRPDLLAELEAGFHFFMPDETTPGGGRSRGIIPVFADGPGGLSCIYYRPFIERAAVAEKRPLSPQAIEALDLFDRLANDDGLQITYRLAPGEMLILNNFRVLHARDEYEDWPEKPRRRSLLRLWLDADWLPTPPTAHAGRRNPMADFL
jgi:hypothetical protein